MGAVMIAATIWLAEGTVPDWAAAEKALAEFECPADGFPKDHPLSDSWIGDTILMEYAEAEASTDEERKKVIDGIFAGALKVVRQAVEGERHDLTWITTHGWRVYLTGGVTSGDLPTDTCEAIGTLDGTGILEAAGFNTNPKTVHVVVLESEYATTVELVPTAADAELKVADFCRQFWDRVVDDPNDDGPPTSNTEAIEKFFSIAPACWSEIRKETSVDHVAL